MQCSAVHVGEWWCTASTPLSWSLLGSTILPVVSLAAPHARHTRGGYSVGIRLRVTELKLDAGLLRFWARGMRLRVQQQASNQPQNGPKH